MEQKSEINGGHELSPLEPAIREIAAVARRHRLDYLQTIYVMRRVRERLGIRPQATPKRLPRHLTERERASFFAAVKRGGNAAHELLFGLLYVTGLRVAELCDLRPRAIDLDACSIRVEQGKGGKDRTVLFPEEMRLVLRLYLESTRGNTYVFESGQRRRMSERRVQQLARQYGEAAGIAAMTPHRLRHTLLTDLTRGAVGEDGQPVRLSDAQIQLLSGHASKKSLAVYQHLALSDVADDYQAAMRRTLGKRP